MGTDAINEVRFEPNLNGIFIRSKIGLVDPLTLDKTVKDLNPHLDYASRTLPQSERDTRSYPSRSLRLGRVCLPAV